MLTCPMCKKSFPGMQRECPTCRTDLSLLVDYHQNMEESLQKAKERTTEGNLAEAVWGYLEVLEVDPDNPEARRQVGRVVRAIRHFDKIAYHRWRLRQRQLARSQKWSEDSALSIGWLRIAVLILLLGAMLFLGFRWGYYLGERSQSATSVLVKE